MLCSLPWDTLRGLHTDQKLPKPIAPKALRGSQASNTRAALLTGTENSGGHFNDSTRSSFNQMASLIPRILRLSNNRRKHWAVQSSEIGCPMALSPGREAIAGFSLP